MPFGAGIHHTHMAGSSCGRRSTASSSTRSASQSKLLAAEGSGHSGATYDRSWSLRKTICVAFSFLTALWVGAYAMSALFIEALIRVSA